MSKSNVSKSAKVTAEGKEKTEAGKRREELKSLLVNKFLSKHADKGIPQAIILEHVNKFLDTMSLTAPNLQLLDERILAAAVKPKPKVEAKVTEKSPAAADVKDDDDKLSVMSGASDFAGNDKRKSNKILDSKTRHVKGGEGEEVKPKNEEDEWVAIMKFNNALYNEEMKQEQLKKAQQKQLMKSELDKQIKEKHEIHQRTKEEEQAYLDYQKKHMQDLEELEKKKEEDRRSQIKSEKQSRDQQRKSDLLRKRIEEAENKKQDQKLIERMKQELEFEKKADKDRKDLEKTTVKRMMEESLKFKEDQKMMSVKEKVDDIKRQEQQSKLSEMQEKEWKDNMSKKDERNKKLLANAEKAAGSKGLKGEALEIDQQTKEQMDLLNKKQVEQEAKKQKYMKEKKIEMKTTLDKQIEEKKGRKVADKLQNQQQAQMWKKDLDLHHEEEQKNSEKLKEVNMKHQEYLLKQMEQAKKAKGFNPMSDKEYLMNKQLLEELKAKAETGLEEAK